VVTDIVAKWLNILYLCEIFFMPNTNVYRIEEKTKYEDKTHTQ